MKFMLLVSLLVVSTPLFSQHYITIGSGATLGFYNSAELDNFAQSYNVINGENMSQLLGGFNGYEGLKIDAGYRYFGYTKFGVVLLGWQKLQRKSHANFNIGDKRSFNLKSNAFFVQGQAGWTFDNFFVGGQTTFFLNRELELESGFSAVTTQGHITALDGNYKASTDLAGDLGLVFGFRKSRVFLTLNMSYPVFSTNSEDKYGDPAKIAEGSDVFPRDYTQFPGTASGISNQLDGLKISLSFAYAFFFRV